MNIIFVGTLPPHPGGTAILASQLLDGFAERGHRVRALAPMTPEGFPGGQPSGPKSLNYSVSRYEVPYFEVSSPIDIPEKYRLLEGDRIGKALDELIGQERPDIVIAGRESFAWHVPAVTKANALSSMMIVHGPTAQQILERTFPEAAAGRLLQEYRKVDLLVTVARHIEDRLRRLGMTRVELIPNAVDSKRFFPAAKKRRMLRELGIGEHEIVVVHPSNLKTLKRPLDLVGSAVLALRKDARLVYIIVGEGPLRDEMERECREKGILDRFRFVGWRAFADMPDYMNLADMVIMPSSTEAMSLVYLEALACGKTLLASDIPAARELLKHGKTGLLFESGNVHAIADTTLLAASSPKMREEIGIRAVKRAQSYSLERAVGKYLAALKKAVKYHLGSRAG